MDLKNVFIGTTGLTLTVLIAQIFSQRNFKENRVEYLFFLCASIVSLYPSIASLLTENDEAFKRLKKETVLAVSMISQLLLITGISWKVYRQDKFSGVTTFLISVLGIIAVLEAF